MLTIWKYKICYTFIFFIRHRTAENNQRHLSHGLKNIFGDSGPNMHYDYALCRVFFVKAELRKFGEVRSHPPLATPLDVMNWDNPDSEDAT